MYLRQACGSEAEGLGSELTVDLKNLFITGFNACIWSMRERENERKSEREEGRGTVLCSVVICRLAKL